MKMSIRQIRTGVNAMKTSDFKTMIRESNRRLVIDWHTNLRPIHFTPEGARRYHYTKRKTKEVTRGVARNRKGGKGKAAPSGLPLVWSGRSRELSRQAKTTATFRRATLSMPVRAFNWRPPKNPAINMRVEFLTVTAAEHRAQETKEGADLRRRIITYRKTKTRKVA